MVKSYLGNNKEQLQKKQKEVEEKEKGKEGEKGTEIKEEIIEEVEVEVGVGIEVEEGTEKKIIIIIKEVDLKKQIFVLIVEIEDIGLMNVLIQKKKGN